VEDVLVVGGGIAGLSAAIALGRLGVRTTVLERGDGASGASIVFQYRPVFALQELGILDEVIHQGSAIEADGTNLTPVFDANGQSRSVPGVELDHDWPVPMAVSIYRPILSTIMQDAARDAGAELLFGRSYRSVEQDGDRVQVELTTGERRRFDLLIAADGVYSGLRDQFFPEAGSPAYTGSMSFRAMFFDAPADWHSGLHVRNGGVVRTTKLPGGLFYIALGAHMERRRVEQDEARRIMREVLATYRGSQLFAQVGERLTDETPVIVAPFDWIFVRAPWHRGRVVLAGDAAHATAPTIGSAGGMALEDAVVLAQELAGADGVDAALRAYTARRHDRAKLVVEASVALLRGEQSRQSDDQWAGTRAAAVQQLTQAY
jgi:2-polyprenyl-6-methoxyphenol hydroxylase-like FAD-dependent oxidoreductase